MTVGEATLSTSALREPCIEKICADAVHLLSRLKEVSLRELVAGPRWTDLVEME
jgi:hypothetical protein